ncbi:MAG: PEP-CTERM sorting domain-containing protein, partial [Caldilinea sp.]
MEGAKFPRLVSTTLFALTAAIALLRTVSAQAPIITPSDISTPTPTPLILPTPTQHPATLP